ncbi:MAG: hypothetical protein FWC60_09565, partial [Firmicutes bacterium]|nr:hypothetical protein [Bacillota bacterium]
SEYTSLLNKKADCHKQIAVLKEGYISTKTIAGKKYAYLQYRVDGKLFSEYIKNENLPGVRAELDQRAATLSRIHEIDGRLDKIEAAAGILAKDLRRKMIIHRRCAAMETMSFGEREKSLAFSSAMTALEGIPASEESELNLSRWAKGELSFQESYLQTLRTYHLAEV